MNDTVIRMLCFLGIILGVFLYIKAGKIKHKQSKYAFENRTSGGVVEFKNHEASMKHKNQGCLTKVIGNIGSILVVISFVILMMSFA